jgi:hypothetical protein
VAGRPPGDADGGAPDGDDPGRNQEDELEPSFDPPEIERDLPQEPPGIP